MGHINKTVSIYDLPYPWLAEAILIHSSLVLVQLWGCNAHALMRPLTSLNHNFYEFFLRFTKVFLHY